MKKWFKAKWTKLYRWYLRVFKGRIITIKPSGTISKLGPYTSGIEPMYRKDYNASIS